MAQQKEMWKQRQMKMRIKLEVVRVVEVVVLVFVVREDESLRLCETTAMMIVQVE